jgi:hypothetical protein
MRLSLNQVLDLHRSEGQSQMALRLDGHVDLIVRNDDGTVDQAASKSNLTTELWLDNWHYYGVDLRYMYLFILPDDGGEMHPLKTAGRHLYPDNYEVSLGPDQSNISINNATRTWTFTAVFGQPSSNRSFRYLGLRARNNPAGIDGNAKNENFIFAMTRMTSDVTQTTTQTLEVVYRVSFTRV